MKNINVLHLLSSNKFSGAENVACIIIKNSNTNSFYCSPNGEIDDILKEKNINYIPIKKLNPFIIKKIVKKYNVDIIHAHDYKASFVAAFIPKVKKISHIHSSFDFSKKWNIYTMIYSIIQKRFSKIILVSKEINDNVIFKDKIKNKSIVLENIVDPNEILKQSKKIKTKKYDLIFVGRIIDIKNPFLFIDIVNEVKKENSKVKAAMIGQGDLFDDCKNKIKNLKLEKNIDLLGFQKNPYCYIANSKVCILPSSFEGLPMSVVESLSLDTPVINSGVGGLKKMYSGYEQYICNSLDEYKKMSLNIINCKNDKYVSDCKKIRKKFTDVNFYSNTINKIYNEIMEEKND